MVDAGNSEVVVDSRDELTEEDSEPTWERASVAVVAGDPVAEAVGELAAPLGELTVRVVDVVPM